MLVPILVTGTTDVPTNEGKTDDDSAAQDDRLYEYPQSQGQHRREYSEVLHTTQGEIRITTDVPHGEKSHTQHEPKT